MKVWITRTRPGAERTAERLGALGIESLIDPVLEVRRLDVSIDLDGVDALAFTSPNGVAAFEGLSQGRSLPVFAVGEATADALRRIGFRRVEIAGGDLGALADLLAARRPGRVLALGPTEPAGDLAALATGVPIEVRAIYETVPRVAHAAVADDALRAVLVHSAKAARALAAYGDILSGLSVIALSEACAQPLRGATLKSIAVAPFPDDTSLVRLTADVLSEAP